MKTIPASAAPLIGAALLAAACTKHDDTANTTVTNETAVTEEGSFNEAAPDLNAATDAPIGNDTLGNYGVGNAAATPN